MFAVPTEEPEHDGHEQRGIAQRQDGHIGHRELSALDERMHADQRQELHQQQLGWKIRTQHNLEQGAEPFAQPGRGDRVERGGVVHRAAGWAGAAGGGFSSKNTRGLYHSVLRVSVKPLPTCSIRAARGARGRAAGTAEVQAPRMAKN